MVVTPCPPTYLLLSDDETTFHTPRTTDCRGALDGQFFLDQPATLEMRFKGGVAPNRAAVGQTSYDIPPGKETVIRIALKRGVTR